MRAYLASAALSTEHAAPRRGRRSMRRRVSSSSSSSSSSSVTTMTDFVVVCNLTGFFRSVYMGILDTSRHVVVCNLTGLFRSVYISYTPSTVLRNARSFHVVRRLSLLLGVVKPYLGLVSRYISSSKCALKPGLWTEVVSTALRCVVYYNVYTSIKNDDELQRALVVI